MWDEAKLARFDKRVRELLKAPPNSKSYQRGRVRTFVEWHAIGHLRYIAFTTVSCRTDMLNSELLGELMGPQQGPAPNAIQESEKRSVGLSLDHLLRHSRIEPLIRKIFPDQRRYDRLVIPHVVAYVGRAHASRPHRIGNISVGGFCMLSDEHWTPGTEMPITLQREEWDGEESPERVSVPAIVARCGLGEVGFSIVLTPDESLIADTSWISKGEMERFLENLNKPKPPGLIPVNCPRERPLPLAERSERLLELARLYSLSAASKLWYTQDR